MPTLLSGVAFGVVGALFVSSAASAAGLDNYPDDPAEAAASVVDTSILGLELAGAGHSEAGYPTSPGPNSAGLELDVLGSELINLGDIEVPLGSLVDFGQLGALLSQSTASGPRDAEAITGLAGGDGSVTLEGADADFGAAEVDLLFLFDELGLSGLTDLAVDEALLRLGAGGAHVIAEDGTFLDPDAVGGAGQYRATEASLIVSSPAIDAVSGDLYTAVGGIDDLMENQVNDLINLDALETLLGTVNAQLNVQVRSNMQDEIFEALLAQPITSKNELLTIDFSTGTIEIHLDKTLSNELRPGQPVGINNQNPNTELIDDELYPMIAGTVHDLIEEVTNIAVGAIAGALGSVTLDFTATIPGTTLPPVPATTATWSVNLMGDATAPVCTGPACLVLNPVLTTAASVISTALVPVRDFILGDAGQQLFELAFIDILTNSVSVPLRAALEPIIEAIAQIISLQLNRQVSTFCELPGGDETMGSLEVSALSLGLFQAADGARLNLGHAGARVDACDLMAGPTLVASSPVPAGGEAEITSSGWEPNAEVALQLTDGDGNPVGDPVVVIADADGNLPAGTTVPVPADATAGTYTIEASDGEGNEASAPLSVYTPALEAESPVAPGDVSEITSGGWPPNTEVTLQLTDADGNPVGDPVLVTTDAEGNIPAGTGVPIPDDAEPGEYTIVATDTNGAEVSAPIVIQAFVPTLTASSPVPAGGESAVTSGGWEPNSGVTLQRTDADGNPVGDPVVVTTDVDGNIPAGTSIPVPANAAAGEYTVVATDADGIETSAPLVVYAPALDAQSPVSPGDVSEITSGGWLPNTEVTLQLTDGDGNPVGDPVVVSTDAEGNVPAGTVVPVPDDAEAGEYTIVATDTNGAEISAPLEVVVFEPTLSVSSPVIAGGETEVTSGGWPADTAVTLQLVDGDGNPVGDPVVVTTDAEGNLPDGTTVPIPDDAAAGAYTLVASDADGNEASAPLTVYAPVLDAQSPVPAGGESEITSGGWLPNTEVTLQLTDGDGNPVGDPVVVTTDAEGNIPAGTTVPIPEGTAPGDLTIVATDEDGAELSVPIVIYAPVLEVDSPVAVGQCADVTSGGWVPNTQVTLQLTDGDGNPVGDPVVVTADAEGNLPDGTCVTIPEGTGPGDYEIVGTDENGAEVSEPVIIYAPSISAESPAGAGTDADITSGGWLPLSTIALQLTDADGNPVGDPVAVAVGPDGNVPAGTTIPIPAGTAAGAYTVVATDPDGVAVSAPLSVYAPAIVAESPVSAGDATEVTSGGWLPNTSVTLQLVDGDGDPVGDPVVVTTDAGGNVPAATTVPIPADAAAGSYSVVATDANGAEVSAPVEVLAAGTVPTLTAESPVPAGGESEVTSGGWEPNTEVTLQLTDADDTPVGGPVVVTTDAEGNIPAGTTLPIPASLPAGTYTIVGSDAENNEASAPLSVYAPAISADSPVSAGDGTEITSGGWLPNTAVTLQLTDSDGNPIGEPVVVTTDAEGNLPPATTVPIPEDAAAGAYTIVARDDNGAEVSAPVVVLAAGTVPTLTATSPVAAGSASTVTSGGWAPNAVVTLQLIDADGNPVGDPVAVTTDAEGNIPDGTTVPIPENAAAGAYRIVGTDADGNEADAPVAVYAPVLQAETPVHPGECAAIQSSGWLPNTEVAIQLRDAAGTPVGEPVVVTTDAQGNVPAGTCVQVPQGTPPGDYEIIATDGNDGEVSTALKVTARTGTGPGDGNGGGKTSKPGSPLATTGGEAGGLLPLALMLLIAGSAFVVARRRGQTAGRD